MRDTALEARYGKREAARRLKAQRAIDYNVRSYPELDRIADQVVTATIEDIRRRSRGIPDYGMAYVRQYVLEEVAKKLQAAV